MVQLKSIARLSAMAGGALFAYSSTAHAFFMIPGDIVISESTYVPNAGESSGLTVGSPIAYPVIGGGPNVAATGTKGSANATAADLTVFNNSAVDGNFGVSAPLSLVQINPANFAQDGAPFALPVSQIVTSFPSKSEGALYLSQDGKYLTIGGYDVAASGRNPVGALDVSNANTTASAGVSSKNSAGVVNRTIAQINATGTVQTTDYNAYSGNNGRGAILFNNTYYAVGNGNAGTVGVEAFVPGASVAWTNTQTAANSTTQIGAYNITQNGYASPGTTGDKPLKDNNYRGEAIYNGTLYVTKGSGSNGINTVYQVGAAGALNNGGQLAANAPITVLPGFSTALAQDATGANVAPFTPFGLWFANATTLYVADEGSGGSADVGLGSHAGLEKWVFNGTTWALAYTLQNGLVGLTQTYCGAGQATLACPNGDGLVGTVTEQGLRQITGVVNADGTVTIYGVTATTDNITNNDNGDDPNQLVAITDLLSATTLPDSESFTTALQAAPGTVVRGVSQAAVPEPASILLFGSGLAGLFWKRRRPV